MKTAEQLNLITILILFFIVFINITLGVFLDKKLGISDLKVIIIFSLSSSCSLSLFLYFVLRYDGFDFVHSFGAFVVLFVFQILLFQFWIRVFR